MEKHIGECIKLVIEFEAGSDFQFDHARSLLEGVGVASAGHLRNTHRKNWCSYEIELLEKNSVSKKLKALELEHKRYQESYLKGK
jgi:hypothetical protein